MTDLRAHLADALRGHQPMFDGEINAASCGCGELEWVPEHLADVLLSLPGIAIVDLTGPAITDVVLAARKYLTANTAERRDTS